MGSWPGYHLFTNATNNNGAAQYLRITIERDSINGNNVNIGQVSLMGSYGGFSRLFDWDVSRNVYFFGNVNTTGRFISTLATGTSPLAVTSTTLNTNLNSDLLDGYHAGNANGNIPVSNGTVNTNLNADLLDGYTAGNANGNIPVSNGTANVNLNADLIDGINTTQIIYGDTAAGTRQASTIQTLTDRSMYKAGFWDVTGASWTPDTGWWWGSTFAHGSNSSSYLYGAQMVFQNSLTPQMYIRGMSGGPTPVTGSWQKVWTDYSDGASSGLDADTVDGYHASNLVVQNTAQPAYGLATNSVNSAYSSAIQIRESNFA